MEWNQLDAVGPIKRKRRENQGDGFTLIEVMAAMGILAFGLLTLAAAQIHAIKQSAAGRHTGDAAAVARTHLEQVHRLPWTDLNEAIDAWVPPTWSGSAAVANTLVDMPGGQAGLEQAYQVDWRVSDVGISGCLRDIEVRVRWTEPPRPDPKERVVATRRYNWGSGGC
jgi:prepilin-type N-terminal cleavage/methylation domain-containing protein